MNTAFLTKRPISHIIQHIIAGILMRIGHQKAKLYSIESWGRSTFARYKYAVFHSWKEQHRFELHARISQKRAALTSGSAKRTDETSHTFAGVPSRCPICDAPRIEGTTPIIVGQCGGWNDSEGRDIGLIWWHSLCTRCGNESGHGQAPISVDPFGSFYHFKHASPPLFRSAVDKQRPEIILTKYVRSGTARYKAGAYPVRPDIEWVDATTGTVVDSREKCISFYSLTEFPKTPFRTIDSAYADKALCLDCGKLCKDHPIAEGFIYEDDSTVPLRRLCNGTLVEIR